MTRAKEVRAQVQVSQTAAAALANVAPNTWRLYEADPTAVRPEVRKKCDAAVEQLAARIEAA